MSSDAYAVLADLVFAAHAFFVLLIIPSCVLAFIGYYRTRPLLWHAHWIAVVIMVVGTVYFARCPLVELEEALRVAAGSALPYDDSFTVYFLSLLTGIEFPGIIATFGSRLVMLLTIGALVTARRREDATPQPEAAKLK